MRIYQPVIEGNTHFTGSLTVTGSLNVTAGISGSFSGSFVGDGSQLSGVSSYTDTDTLDYINTLGVISGSEQIASDISGSLGPNATLIRSLTALSITGSNTAFSSSVTQRVSTVEQSVDSLNSATSSYLLNTTDTLDGNLTVTGTITAQEFHTEFVSASIIYESGSTKFGNTSDDKHEFTGSVFVSNGITGTLTGNASTATTLQTARTIGGVSFDGSANINLPGVNTTGNQNTSGNAATATSASYAATGPFLSSYTESDTLATVTGRGASTGTQIQLTSTSPLSFTGNSNTGTFTQTTWYFNQNNVSNDNANGIFIERGRLTNASDGEIRNFIIGARGGDIQFKVDKYGEVYSRPGLGAGGFYLGDSGAGLYRDNTYDVVLTQNNSSGGVLYLAGAGNVIVSIDNNDNETDRKFIVGSNAVKASNELFSVNESGTGYFAGGVTMTGASIGRVVMDYDGTDSWFRMQSGNRMRITTTGGNDVIIPNTGNMTYNGNTMWHSGNDGGGSGLDADLLDGVQGSGYFRYYETTAISSYDTLTAGAWSTTSTTATSIPYGNYNGTWHISDTGNDRQYQLWMGDTSAGGLRFRAKQGSSTGWHAWEKVWTDVNDGAGSGLDADTVDGVHAASFLRSDTSGTITSDLTIQGGSTVGMARNSRAYGGSFGYLHIKDTFAMYGLTDNNAMHGHIRATSTDGLFLRGSASGTFNTYGFKIDRGTHVIQGSYGGGVLGDIIKTTGFTPALDIGDSTNYAAGRKPAVTIYSTLNVKDDVVAFYSSDRNLKDNIKPIENALEKVEAIGGYEFDWNDKQDIHQGHDLGVIAQEVEAVLPELVQTRVNGYKAVKYEKLTAVLIQAVKELSARVKELENK